MADFDTDSEIGTEYVRGTRPPGATYGQTFSLSDIGQSLLLYQQGLWTQFFDPSAGAAAAAAASAGVLPEVIVEARRPPPPPPPLEDDEEPEDVRRDEPTTTQESFVAPVVLPEVLPEVVVRTSRPTPTAPRAPARSPMRGPGVLGLLGLLVPPYLKILGDVDAYGTEHALERMFPPRTPNRRPPRVAEPELPPERFRYGRPQPWGISGPPLPDDDRRPGEAIRPVRGPAAPGTGAPLPDEFPLPEIVVTGRAPRVLPSPAWWDIPFAQPGVEADPLSFPVPSVVDQPRRRPEVVDDPFTTPVGDPFPDVRTEPAPGNAVVPERPTRTPVDTDAPLPGGGPAPELGFGPDPVIPPPGSPTNVDTCACPKPKKKKSNKKDRTICYGGTFTEKSKSLSKRRRYRVDCKTGKKLGSDLPKNDRTKPAPKPRQKPGYPVPPSWEVPQP